MSKSAIRRVNNYQRKLDEEHVAKQLTLAHDQMATAYAQAQAELRSVEETARAILGQYSIASCDYPSYLNFTRQVWKARNNFGGGTLKIEVQVLIDKWKARKRDVEVLEAIRDGMFAVDKPPETT
jgi:hypothetical protein